jgi:hypothetical protein
MSINNNITIRHQLNCEIPCIKLESIDHTEVGYLMPFRAYRFQVCGNADGEGDYGSSDVRQMKEAMQYEDEYTTYAYDYMREQAMIAIMRWLPDYRFGISMSDDDMEIFEAFLKECFDWVKSLG